MSFIKIGDVRIKKSNIKNYGTSKESLERAPEGFWGKFFDISTEYDREYLYITTFQGDNYKFYADEVDIDSAIRSLDRG